MRHPVAFAWRIALCSQFQRPQSDGPSGRRRQGERQADVARTEEEEEAAVTK